jgi:hypothetical protein
MRKPRPKTRVVRLRRTAQDFMRRAKRARKEEMQIAYALMARSCYALAGQVEQVARKG